MVALLTWDALSDFLGDPFKIARPIQRRSEIPHEKHQILYIPKRIPQYRSPYPTTNKRVYLHSAKGPICLFYGILDTESQEPKTGRQK